MGLAHRTLPLYGVQYHPESVGTSHGQQLIRNFRALAAAWPQNAGALAGHLAWSSRVLGTCHAQYASPPHPGRWSHLHGLGPMLECVICASPSECGMGSSSCCLIFLLNIPCTWADACKGVHSPVLCSIMVC